MVNQVRVKRKWGFLRVVATLILTGILFEGLMMLAVYAAGERKRPLVESDVIIVLGARIMPDGEISTTLLHRLNKALEVYDAGYADHVIVCGARGADEPEAEADAMARYLIKNGVPGDRVLRDPNSYDTAQNLANAKAIMGERGFASAIIVTSEYHLQRALWLARDVGLSATGQGSLGQNLKRNRVRANFRETLSWLNYFTGGLLGRILGLSEDSNG